MYSTDIFNSKQWFTIYSKSKDFTREATPVWEAQRGFQGRVASGATSGGFPQGGDPPGG